MKYMTASEIRNAYLQFFQSKGHTIVPSSPVVPEDDPTLLFTNAGMNQFKNCYLGIEKREYTRATTSQKCIRAGGKHNDLDNVGYTARHHTFFEMLGNFSFGDYFKQDAIPWAWEFLTKVLELPEDRLWVTVYVDDDEAYDIWNKEIGIPAERIVRIGDNKGGKYMSDNFWMMGDTGPCGPCSEIFFDRGPSVQGGPPGSKDKDGDRYLEIWNLVFTQFNRDASGKMNRLPHPNIDTGMGLERIASVIQNVPTNYDIDLFRNLMAAAKAAVEKAGATDVEPGTPSLKVIADHIRACSFAIADGVLPGNEGRAYVLRRICRRAIRHGYKLGARAPFFYTLVEPLAREMGDVYPELNKPNIAQVIKAEEERFFLTLANGMEILEDAIAKTTNGVLDGNVVFKLHDTFGFPADLTADVCREKGIKVDTDAFDRSMEEQRAKARAAGKFKIAAGLVYNGPTNEFRGYQELRTEGCRVLAIYKDGTDVTSAEAGDDAVLVFDKTPCYAEMGGQVADHGTIHTETAEFTVTDVQKNKGGKFMHYGKLVSGSLAVGDTVTASIDAARRKAIMRAHSATHLLDYALRTVLGDHAHQAGSLVEPDRLRYDFTHFSAVTADELVKISRLVSELVLDGMSVETKEMPIAEAKKLGAIALFGEKYGDVVRVVNMGGKSVELCGGTHVDNTAKVGPFRITSESSVASGVRRIEAVTGEAFLNLVDEMNMRLVKAAELLKTTPMELINKAQSSMNEIRELHQTIERMKDKLFAGDVDSLMFSAKDVNGLKVVTASRENTDANDLRKLGDFLRDKNPNTVAALGAVNGEKVTLLAVCGKNAVARGIKAGDIIKNIAPIVGGKGGGKPDSAMGGGTNALKLDDALAAVDDYVAANVKD